MTYGERAVDLTSNPSGDVRVDEISRAFAEIIDWLDETRSMSNVPEIKRMCGVAITEAQNSQMWAVKALTWKDE